MAGYRPDGSSGAVSPSSRWASRREAAPTDSSPGSLTTTKARTEALLRQWRQTRAGGNTQPEAVVSDAILEAIAAAAPVTLEQLARVKGLGPGRLERYGDEILATVAEALADD